jgi:hypothetical protein
VYFTNTTHYFLIYEGCKNVKKRLVTPKVVMLMHDYTHARTLETKGLKMGLRINFLIFQYIVQVFN